MRIYSYTCLLYTSKMCIRDRVKIKPSGIRRFFDMADSYDDCISLGVGEPDFKTPWHIRSAGIENLKSGATRYTAVSYTHLY